MDDPRLLTQIVHNAQLLNEMHTLICSSYKNKNKDKNKKAWQDACTRFHDSYDALAFPGGLERAFALLQRKDSSILPNTLAYLKADPYFYRSGYIKGALARHLKKFTLNKEQIKDLQASIIALLFKPRRAELKEYYRLALKISDNDFLIRLLELIEHSDDPGAVRRANNLVHLLQKHT